MSRTLNGTRTTRAATAVASLIAAGVIALVSAATPAASCSLAAQNVTIDPAEAVPGTTVTITGTDIYAFPDGLGADCSGLIQYVGPATVLLFDADTIYMGDGPAPATSMSADVTVNATSGFSMTMTIPTDAKIGSWDVALQIGDAVHPTSATLQVTEAAPPTTTTSPAEPIDRDPTYTG